MLKITLFCKRRWRHFSFNFRRLSTEGPLTKGSEATPFPGMDATIISQRRNKLLCDAVLKSEIRKR